MDTLRIGFMGTPDFAVQALQALIDSHHEVVCVFSQPPRPKGRGKKVQPSPVHSLAEQHNIPVHTPISFKKDAEALAQWRSYNLDVGVIAAYGLILPQDVLDTPRYGCLNIHGSLLPRWRGASPIQCAIRHGDKETGIGIMQMVKALDAGPVIAEEALPITQDTTAQALHDDLAVLGARMIVDTLDKLAEQGQLNATPQDETAVTYAPLLTKEDSRIDWTKQADNIDCLVRGFNPWPGVWTMTAEYKRLKILQVSKTSHQSKESPGTILDKDGHVACGAGTVIRLVTIQPENAKPMDFSAALNGGYVKLSEVLV